MANIPAVRYGRVPKRSRESCNDNNMAEVPRNLTPPPMHREAMAAGVAVADAGPGPAPPVVAAAAAPPLPPPPPQQPLGLPIPLPTMQELEADELRLAMARDLADLAGRVHDATTSYSETLRDNRRGLLIQLRDYDDDAPGDEEASSTTDHFTDARSLLWPAVAVRLTPNVQHLVEFAKRMPGFNSLPQDDQLILIKLGFFEVFMTRAHRACSPDYLMLDDGSIVTEGHLGLIYDPGFAGDVLQFMWSLWQMQMDDCEVGAFSGLLLTSPVRPGLSAPGAVADIHRALGDALRIAVAERVALEPALVAPRLRALAHLAGQARSLGARHPHAMRWCRNNWYRLTLPALFAEIFDIPKSEKEAKEAALIQLVDPDPLDDYHPRI